MGGNKAQDLSKEIEPKLPVVLFPEPVQHAAQERVGAERLHVGDLLVVKDLLDGIRADVERGIRLVLVQFHGAVVHGFFKHLQAINAFRKDKERGPDRRS